MDGRGIELLTLKNLIFNKHSSRTRLPKGKFEALVLYIILVLEGLREAYLVDNIAILEEELLGIVCEICLQLQKEPLVVIALGDDDFILISRAALSDKLHKLKMDNWGDNHIVIDIDPSLVPTQLHDHQIVAVKELLAHELNEIFKYFTADPTAGRTKCPLFRLNAESRIGFPFIAGWLLGYPFIYLSTQPTNSLSMVPLTKFSILGDITSFKQLAGQFAPRSDIDLMEFSVPQCILDEFPSNQTFLDDWVARKLALINEYISNLDTDGGNQSRYAKIIDSIRVVSEPFVLPTVML